MLVHPIHLFRVRLVFAKWKEKIFFQIFAGVFGPSTTPFSTAAFGQPASTFNYYGNGDYSTWGQLGRAKQYDDYYRTDVYVPEGIKAVDAGMQGLSLADHKAERERPELKDVSAGSQTKKMTWASIASQPAKPAPSSQSTVLKKKGPGMPPPPIVPGKHNMDMGAWDASKSAPVVTAPPPPQVQAPPLPAPLPLPVHAASAPTAVPVPMPAAMSRAPPPHHQPPPVWTRAPPPHVPRAPLVPAAAMSQPPPATIGPGPLHPLLDELSVKNEYNPKEFDMSAPQARFFVIKSYSEDDIHRSIKYEIWCSTEHGNKRLDSAYREREREGGCVYLYFSVNGSGHFCGMARMISAVDYNSNSSVWLQDKWKGQFRVRWVYVKDVPNVQLRHIKLENNENKPVTNSRDTQEVPHPKGLQVLRIMHCYCHTTSIFDDFTHYEKRQEEEDSRKVPIHNHQENSRDEHEDGGGRGGYRNYREFRDQRDGRDGRDHREPRDYNRDHRDPRDGREQRDGRDTRDNRDHREHREDRDPRDNRDHNVYRDRDSNFRPHHRVSYIIILVVWGSARIRLILNLFDRIETAETGPAAAAVPATNVCESRARTGFSP